MTALTLEVLGGFSMRDSGGEEILLRGKKARALLTYLVLQPTAVGRERLANVFWGEMSDERARHNLRQSLSEIRKAVGSAALLNDEGRVGVRPDAFDVDAIRLRSLSHSADAATIYTGELLHGFELREDAFDDWLSSERERLRDLACEALALAARDALRRGDLDACAAAARRRLEIDPSCETAHRLMMEVHRDRGDRSAAIRQFEVLSEALSRRFGTEPSGETQALLTAIQTAAVGTAAAPSASEERPAPAPSLPDKPSVAVLPFENLSGDPTQQYFSDGITEDLIVGLSRFDALFVIARSSSFRYRDNADERTIGRALGVHFIARGSVRQHGTRVRIAARLIDAGTGETVWAERFDRELTDIFAVQDEVTREVVATIAGRVESARLAHLRRVPMSDLVAYDFLLRGKDHHHRYSADDNRIAQELLSRALELDPDSATVHAWMACVVAQSNSFVPDPSVFERAYEHVLFASKLDDGESECHRVLAAYYLIRRRFDDAQRHQHRALELNPNDDRIVCQMGELLTFLGRPEEALPWVEQALRLNPHHPANHRYEHGRALYGLGRSADAATALAAITSPRYGHLALLAACHARSGDSKRARDTAELVRAQRPAFDGVAWARGLPYERAEDADRLAADLRLAGLADDD